MLSQEALAYIHFVIIFLVVIAFALFMALIFLKNSHKAIHLFTIAIVAFISNRCIKPVNLSWIRR